jgi:hypothetical protein
LYVNMGITAEPSYWTYSKQIQPLAIETYDLEVRAFDNGGYNPYYRIPIIPALS